MKVNIEIDCTPVEARQLWLTVPSLLWDARVIEPVPRSATKASGSTESPGARSVGGRSV